MDCWNKIIDDPLPLTLEDKFFYSANCAKCLSTDKLWSCV